ncbi:hypothetical protein VdG1_05182 [Verticillium dahliae VDG1]|nr:hypothetical protein VdG1_05182 [Verticillium dahliae VDG1]
MAGGAPGGNSRGRGGKFKKYTRGGQQTNRMQAEKEEREAQEAARKAEIDAKEAKKREAALGKKTSKKAK